MLLSGEVRELHHNWRANSEHLVDMRLLLDKLFDTNGHYAFLAVTTVIGHDDNLVRTLAYLIFKNNEVL